MSNRVRWGVLSSSRFFLTKVLPAVQKCREAKLWGLASRDAAKAEMLASEHGFVRAYGSYEALLADPEIEAVYIPLPNHRHVPMAKAAAEAGKHVLCEKPIGLNAGEVEELIAVRDRTGVKIGEAFMVATHPQWLLAKEWVTEGRIGELKAIQGFFSYHNVDPNNIRNKADLGGGALMDIGCYPIFTSRFVSGLEPERVVGLVERDPEFGTDRVTSAVLDFGPFQASFTCSTQMAPYQRMHFFGTKGHIEIEIPFNAPPDRPSKVMLNGEVHETAVVDQYTIEFDTFSRAVRGETAVPVGLESARGNMRVIDAVFASAVERRWIAV